MQVARCWETGSATWQASLGLAGSLTLVAQGGLQLHQLIVRAPAEGFAAVAGLPARLRRGCSSSVQSGVLLLSASPGSHPSKGFPSRAPQAEYPQGMVGTLHRTVSH